ncbi:MAG TPA: hypothetical protein VFY05_08750 [Candidatus Angelobacter sp.]|nr:hypothetical protein [Candidatus Angelobacter sp.]
MNTTKRNESGWILSREYGDPEATCRYNSGYYADYEIEEVKKQHEEYWAKIQKESYEKWVSSEPGKMCVEMYAKFQEYKKFLEEHPWARDPRGYLEKYAEHELFAAALGEVSNHQAERAERDRKNLEKAIGGAMRARLYGRRALRSAENAREEALPDAPSLGRSEY